MDSEMTSKQRDEGGDMPSGVSAQVDGQPLASPSQDGPSVLIRRSIRRRLLGVMAGAGVLSGAPLVAMARLVDTVPRVKPSVVAVGTFQRTRNPSFAFRGTGFSVADGRLIATNAHVIPATVDAERMETIAIALPGPRGGSGVVRPARVVAKDDTRDLAVLRIEGDAIPPLTLDPANDSALEGQEIAFMGFPIGEALGLVPVTHRGIISAITPIGLPQIRARDLNPSLIRQLSSNPFLIYQLDATAYPGNSGSPVFDPDSGRVIAVINMVYVKSSKENILSDPSGISYAIPVRHLRDMISRI